MKPIAENRDTTSFAKLVSSGGAFTMAGLDLAIRKGFAPVANRTRALRERSPISMVAIFGPCVGIGKPEDTQVPTPA